MFNSDFVCTLCVGKHHGDPTGSIATSQLQVPQFDPKLTQDFSVWNFTCIHVSFIRVPQFPLTS